MHKQPSMQQLPYTKSSLPSKLFFSWLNPIISRLQNNPFPRSYTQPSAPSASASSNTSQLLNDHLPYTISKEYSCDYMLPRLRKLLLVSDGGGARRWWPWTILAFMPAAMAASFFLTLISDLFGHLTTKAYQHYISTHNTLDDGKQLGRILVALFVFLGCRVGKKIFLNHALLWIGWIAFVMRGCLMLAAYCGHVVCGLQSFGGGGGGGAGSIAEERGGEVDCSTIIPINTRDKKRSAPASNAGSAAPLINRISIDTQRICSLVQFTHLFWSMPLRCLLVFTLVLQSMGLAAFPGILFIVLTAMSMIWMHGKIKAGQKRVSLLGDVRLSACTQLLTNCPSIKSLALTPAYLRELEHLRVREMQGIRTINRIFAIIATLNYWSPSMATLLSLLGAHYLGGGVDLSGVFGSARAFSTLSIPLWMIPLLVEKVAGVRVAFERIDGLLDEFCSRQNSVDLLNNPHLPDGHHQRPGESAIIATSKYENHSHTACAGGSGALNASWQVDPAATAESGCQTNYLCKNASWTTTKAKKSSNGGESDENNCTLQGITIPLPGHAPGGGPAIVQVCGAPGSGKSLLLRALSGLLPHTHTESSGALVHRLRPIAWCPEKAWMPVDVCVEDAVLMGRERDADGALLSKVLSAMQLTDSNGGNGIREQCTQTLSGGQRQRLAICRALYGKPRLLCLDDCVGGVDDACRKAIISWILSESGCDVVVMVCDDQVMNGYCRDGVVAANGGGRDEYVRVEMVASGADPVHATAFTCHSSHINIADEGRREDKGTRKKATEHEEFANSSSTTKDTAKCASAEKSTLLTFAHSLHKLIRTSKHGLFYTLTILALLLTTELSTILQMLLIKNMIADGGSMFGGWRVAGLGVLAAMPLLGQIGCHLLAIEVCWSVSLRVHEHAICALVCDGAASGDPILSTSSDSTSAGRVASRKKIAHAAAINRLSGDLEIVDTILPQKIVSFLGCVSTLLTVMLAVCWFTPTLLPFLGAFFASVWWKQGAFHNCWHQLMVANRIALCPVMDGLSVVGDRVALATLHLSPPALYHHTRALTQQLDTHTLTNILSTTARRWISMRTAVLATIYCACIGIGCACITGVVVDDVGVVGLLMLWALRASDQAEWIIKHIAEIDHCLVSVDRLLDIGGGGGDIEHTTVTVANGGDNAATPPQSTPPAAICIKDTKVFSLEGGPLPILSISSLTIPTLAHKNILVSGKSGAGKSTLLTLLASLCDGVVGDGVLVDGVALDEYAHPSCHHQHPRRSNGAASGDGAAKAERQCILANAQKHSTMGNSLVSLVTQSPWIDCRHSLLHNLDPLQSHSRAHLLSTLSWLAPNLKEDWQALVERGDTTTALDTLPAHQQQCIHLARHILLNPPILCLDESTTTLPSHLERSLLQTILRRRSALGLITLVVSHGAGEWLLGTGNLIDGEICVDAGNVLFRSHL